MTDKRRQAFEAMIEDDFGFMIDRNGEGYLIAETQALWFAWQKACDWCAKPPEPESGALVLDKNFFKRN